MSRKRSRQMRPNWNAGINAQPPKIDWNCAAGYDPRGNVEKETAVKINAYDKKEGDKTTYFRIAFYGETAERKAPVGHYIRVGIPEEDNGKIYFMIFSKPVEKGKKLSNANTRGPGSYAKVPFESKYAERMAQFVDEYPALPYDTQVGAYYVSCKKENHINADTGK